MKVLVIGDPNSLFIQNYVKNLNELTSENLEIDLLGTFIPFRFGEAGKYFRKTFLLPASNRVYFFLKAQYVVRFFYLYIFLLFNRSKYNVIHCFYAYKDYTFIKRLFDSWNGRLILTIYGSDLYGIKDDLVERYMKFFARVNIFTFANPNTQITFQKKFSIESEKLTICRFGLEPLKELKQINSLQQAECRQVLDLPPDKIIVAVGYNFDYLQQHSLILDSIFANEKLIAWKNKLLFIFPMTNGRDIKNKNEIVSRLKDFPYDFKVFQEFLTDYQMACLRRSSDIMIQVQRTDQLSGSMQEHLYAGNIVITGKWLPYDTFINNGIYFKSVDTVNKVGDELLSCLNEFPQEKEKCGRNPEIIFSLSSWEKNINDWLSLYKGS